MFFHFFSFFSKLVFASFLALSFSSKFSFGVTPVPLPSDEVRALREIAKTLGKTDWNFNVDPCSGKEGWVTNSTSDYRNNVTCDYNIDDVPHVVSIILRRQSLKGILPPELVKLPYLQNIDLTRNYLNGTTPPGWSSLKLVNITLAGNRISGSVPKEFGNISTLLFLDFESNQLSGTVPRELGNLKNLEKLRLTSNYLSGELPTTLANLTSLEEFWIGDNYFTGQIPNYIQKWKNLKKLFIQASGLNGSIPSGIAALVNLTDLRITDMSGNDQPFPPLTNMRKLKYLILRSCNIADALPPYLGNLQNLTTLDLSFNKLHGQIPKNYSNLSGVSHIYLTGNLLNGSVPEWTKNGKNVDLSYNNFIVESSSEICPQNNVTGIVPCLDHQCPKDSSSYSLNINCGGEATISSENIVYEKDIDLPEQSIFLQTSSKWVFRSTGHFMDVDKGYEEMYINSTSASRIHGNNSELYANARISALSLAYYGLCLGNGKYAVNLHFAEIMFSDGETYGSLGRRIFDIFIQGKLVQKDFNIAAEAGGFNKPIIKPFSAEVTHNVLEIRFYWAGRGTTSVPSRGMYGPLISAISAVSEHEETSLLPAGEIVGIAAAVAAFILLVLGVFFWWKGCIGKRNAMAKDQETGSFTLKQIKAATNNFNAVNKIGEGGFGPVYKGVLSDGTMMAVKILSSKSKQGHREFMAEIGLISALQHPNLVELYGCCNEEDHLLLVYEYLENNSLARALFGSEQYRLKLEWPTRHMICVGIARGLAYLHEESRLKIVHRDIKATNVLLDKDLNPKISDFGLAKLNDEENTHISTRIAGTLGYMAPEYALHGYLTDKADVYSFGIVALEIVSGKSNTTRGSKEDCFNLLDWATNLKENGSQMELVDPRLGSEFNEEEAMDMINVALLCTNISLSVRPTMSSVVSMLEGKTIVPELASDSRALNEEMKFMAMKKHFKINEEEEEKTISDSCRLLQNTIDGTSASDFDLYPISVGS